MDARFFIVLILLVVAVAPEFSAAQMDGCPQCKAQNRDSAELIEQADRFYAEFKPREGAAVLRKALQLEPRNLEALAKLSRAHIDMADSIPESHSNWNERRLQEYRTAENYARQAIKVDSTSTWGHFYLAASLGSMAGVSPVARQIEMADEIRVAAEKAIALDPQNGFAYHIYGVWHRRMAELGKTRRMFASLWYGSVPSGDLEKSTEFLKKAVFLNPDVIVSQLELARTHVARHEWAAARAQLNSVAELPAKFSDDGRHKQKAHELLEEIKDR